jgi:hypothetical protein
MRQADAILDHEHGRHHPCALTAEEVVQLLRAFTWGKTSIDEADALTLCHWAQAQKVGAYVLALVLAGHLCVEVAGSTVTLRLPPRVPPGTPP